MPTIADLKAVILVPSRYAMSCCRTAIVALAVLACPLASQGSAPATEPFATDWFDSAEAMLAKGNSPIFTDTKIGTVPPPASADPDERPRLNLFWDNGAVMESADKAFRLHIGGRFDFDNTFYHQSQDLPFLLQDGADMRRARLRADGSIGENIDFVTEVNFANIQDVTNEDSTAQIGSVGLTDFYATFKQVPLFQNVRVGHFAPPIGLEFSTSSNDCCYMERSPGNDAFLLPINYVTGAESFNTWCDDRITGTIAFERVGKQDISPFAFGSGPGKYAVTGRVTGLPFYADDGRQLLHLGIGYCYGGTENNFYAANRPLVRAGAGSQDVPNIIYTGTYYTPNAVQIADAEFAAVAGRYSLSAEYQLAYGSDLYSQLNNGVFSAPHGDVTYQGFYVEGGFFLNADDYRRFDKKEGVWGRQLAASSTAGQPPRATWLFDHTPVQLICRYSYLNLASGNPVLTPSSGAQAGWEHDITAGVDWYINPEVHFVVNYVYTQLTYVNNTSGDINGLGCRLHLDF
jgi:phosphate-selective porin OprO/OprP